MIFNPEVEYLPGKYMYLADLVSRNYIEDGCGRSRCDEYTANLKASNRRNSRRNYSNVRETRRSEGKFPLNDRLRRRSNAFSK